MKIKSALLLIMVFLLQTMLYAQDNVLITGKVIDSDELSLPGVNIIVKGTSRGTQTDFEGNFSIESKKGEILVFSYVWLESQEIRIQDQTTLTVQMYPATDMLDEIVVIGYGTQRKSDITGSIEVVQGEVLTKQPNANAVSSIQGRVAGVSITNSGRPGEAPNVRIRGIGSVSNADPLYVVDGVLTDDISYLNSTDIESLSILKDASSSAIYGIRAANGVIVIKTKRGKGVGDKISLTYDAFGGFQKVNNIPDLVNTSQYVELYNEKQVFEGSTTFIDVGDFDGDTDWFDEILKTSSFTTSHNISVSGTSTNTRYFLGFGYFGQEGILDAGKNINSGDDFRRLTGRVGLDLDVTQYITIGGSIAYTDNKRNIAQEPFAQAYIAPPLFNPINADGSYGAVESIGNFGNPRGTLDFSRSKSKDNRILANVYTEIKPIEDLKLRVSFSGDYATGRDFIYTPVFRISTSQGADISTLERNQFENDNWLWENTVTWNKIVGKHDFTLLGGFSQEERISFRMQGIVNDVDFNGDDAVLFLDLGDVDSERLEDRGSKIRFQSVFGRLQYNFDSKYLLNATLRRDGASSFPSENNEETFPSIGIGWVLSNESFMENISTINSLKLKASWGKLGNANVPRGFDVTAENPGITFFGGQSVVSRSISEFSDPSIFWEIVEEYDLGLEFALLDNQLSGEINYYNRETQDAVFQITQLASSGATNTELLTNAGSFSNKGLEISLNWEKQVTPDFKYTLYGNLTTIKNEVTEVVGSSFLNAGPALFGNAIVRLEKGAEIGAYYGFVVDGVVQTEAEATALGSSVGAFKFKDLSGDGLIGEDDKAFLGSPIPEFTYGFGFNLEYKHVDFSMDFQGVSGNEIYNFNRNSRFGNESWDLDFYENRWTPQNGSNTYPSPNSDQNSLRPNSFFVEDGSYFRIRNIQLGYTLPQILFKDQQIWDTFRIYVNAQNLLTLFDYNGFSPEINGGSVTRETINSNELNNAGIIEAGVDRNVYPLSSTYTLGINVTF